MDTSKLIGKSVKHVIFMEAGESNIRNIFEGDEYVGDGVKE